MSASTITVDKARQMLSASGAEVVQNLKFLLTNAPTAVKNFAIVELRNRGAI